MFDKLYCGNTIQQWMTALFFILATFILGRVVYLIFDRVIRKTAFAKKIQGSETISVPPYIPLVTILIIIGIRISISTLKLSEAVSAETDRVFTLLYALIIAWLLTRIYEVIHKRLIEPVFLKKIREIDERLTIIFKKGIKIIIWISGCYVGMSRSGYNLTTLFAGLGIGGLAFALAGQDILSNFFSGIVIFLQRPFAMGDYIEVSSVRGRIKNIGIRSTVVKDFYGTYNYIPNRIITDNIIKNIDCRTCYFFSGMIHLPYNTRSEKIEKVIGIIRDIPGKTDLLEDKCGAGFKKIDNYSYVIDYWFAIKKWIPEKEVQFSSDYEKQNAGETHVNLEIVRQFSEHGIDLALPVQVRSSQDADAKRA